MLEEQPSDQVLMEVARKSLCSELELGIELKIKHHDIVNSLPIHENCSRGERKIELLLLWKRQKGCDATNRVLLSALNECGNRDKHLLEAVTCKMLIENGTEKCYVAFVSAMLLNEVCRPSFDVSLEMTPGRDIDILKSENVELKSENSALRSENNDLKNENKELKRRCSMLEELNKRKDSQRQDHIEHHDDGKDGLMSTISSQETPLDLCRTYLPISHQSTDRAFDSSHQSFTTVVTYDASANLYLTPKSSCSGEMSPIVISDTEEVDTVPELSPDDITDNPDESIDCSQDSV